MIKSTRPSPSTPSFRLLSLLFLFYFKTDAFNYSQNSICNSNDLKALYDFSQSLDTKIYVWPLPKENSSRCCSWPGVHCALLQTPFSPNSGKVRVVGLDLSGKGLQGVLSSSISGLENLSFLNLSHNSFRGSIPPELFHLKLLQTLDLSSNQFSGELSPGIGNLSSLHHLDIDNNNFTGIIPDAFYDMQNLQVFSAESNRFVGGLPASLSSCSMLTLLSLSNNSLDGIIDLNFTQLPRLTKLDLERNRFHGLIPEALSSCKALEIISFARNNLSGRIPKKLSELQSLNFLNVGVNRLSNISEAFEVLQECHNLTVLILSWNFQGETISVKEIRGFRNIRVLGVGNCALTGSIPTWFRNLKELRALDLHLNQLNGGIPSWIGEFVHLSSLELSSNLLSGIIPVSLTQVKSLTSGVTQKDEVSSFDPPFFKWDRDNFIYDDIKYKHYTDFPPLLDLSHNKLNGPIPKEFGNFKYLHVLDLSWNKLSGSIPEELSGMVNLEKLDLSFNNLSGSIPSSLTRLTFLSSFSVAYNHLQGLIPSAAQFFSFPCSSFEGNPGLYSNSPHFCNSNLNTTDQKEGDKEEENFIVFGLPFAIGFVVSFLATVYLSMCCYDPNYHYE
ncbi:hypothetical protein Cni_G16024 [Canna indica]|uniref:Leucine-rich repeat-containing N-terminal plant-type domain-containing protein n=1 Tax=Canna indica TaxID=4628 RepID=A0AAQ3KEF6_9LILI|nr:hypothetical protein Cni_G16024 [Canna indica]